jgi:hypothetical protein
MVRIPSSEVHFHPTSFGDPVGRLFWWQGQLYRGISHGEESFVRQLFQEGIVRRLLDKGLLVGTELTEFALDGYSLIVKHERIRVVSYCYEWCFEMLKVAALLLIDLEIELAQCRLTLKDGHPWNVLFEGTKPVYVDFGSVRPDEGSQTWRAYEEFCRFFVHPLRLMAHGQGRVARWLLHDTYQGVLEPEVVGLMRDDPSPLREIGKGLWRVGKGCIPTPLRPAASKGYDLLKAAIIGNKKSDSRLTWMRNLRHEIAAITLPAARTSWSEYYRDSFHSFAPSEGWTPKHHSVYEVLSEVRPSSVVDIGSNRGWYSQLAAVLGSKVVGLDVDEVCVGQLYSEAKEKELPIVPLVMDFRSPSPGYGVCHQEGTPAMARLRCEFVLALALLHHLVFRQSLTFEQICEGLAALSERWLLVEFIPRGDRVVDEWWSEEYSWYTRENFVAALTRHFGSVKVYPSEHEPRILLLCEK